ncbi:MAG: zinc-binding dehydrogenase [Erysipelotrichaceae bacterium]|nr:zinc-binding dehydrogenase [Erysipelotrichaceae bacterium]
MKMRTVVSVAPHTIEIREVERPKPGKNQVLVEVKSCNICTWEQRVFAGEYPYMYPFNGGHEAAGVICELGEDVIPEAWPVGTKVAVRTLDSCGACYYCRHNAPNLCTHKLKKSPSNTPYEGIKNLGGFSEFICVDIAAVYPLPQDMDFHKAIFAEPLACVLNSVNQTNIEMGSDVVVIGGGIMGMLHLMCAKLKGARVILSEMDDTRRALALELGADAVINPREVDAVQAVKDLTEGRGADTVFNTTAIPAVAKQAVDMTGYMGTVVMYSSQHPAKDIEISPSWLHSSQAKITGTVSPSIVSFEQSVNMLKKNLIDTTKLFYGSFPIEKATEAFETAMRPDTYRCAIDFDASK